MGATKAGAELSIGDTLQVWWGLRKVATVTGFRAHDSGQEGWFVADFNDGFSMTIKPLSHFRVMG